MESKKFSCYFQAAMVFIMAFATLGLAYGPFAMYLPALCEDMGISYTSATAIYSFQAFASMAMYFLVAPLTKKLGIKGYLWLGAIASIGCFACMYFAKSLAPLYVAGILLGVTLNVGAMSMPLVVPNWFVEKTGTILGVCMAASGLGGLIGTPIFTKIITTYGWRTSCLVSLVAIGSLMVIANIFIKPTPQEVGQFPYGYKATSGDDVKKTVPLPGPDSGIAMKSKGFIFGVIAVVGIVLAVQGFSSQFSNMYLVAGYSMTFAGTAVTIYQVFNTLDNILLGVINDRYGFKAAWIWQCMVLPALRQEPRRRRATQKSYMRMKLCL